MNAVVIIPARYGSTRFPAKMLADLGGKPLFVRTVERARLASSISSVILATDDERIARVAREHGIEYRMTRPDHPSGTDRIAEVAKDIPADVIVNVQGDEPFIDPALIDALVHRLSRDAELAMATARTPILHPNELHEPSVVKVVCDNFGRALYFSRSLIPFSRDTPPESRLGHGLYFRHLGIYAYRRSFLMEFVRLPPHPLEETEKLEQLRALAHGASIAVLDSRQVAPGIDTPSDLAAAKLYLASLETP